VTAKAIVADDFLRRRQVRIAISPEEGRVLTWDHAPANAPYNGDVELSDDAWLHLTDDEARALYEALGRHYGGDVVNARQLRKDYDAERGRVDKLIDNLMVGR
jgi:hypothetical protein